MNRRLGLRRLGAWVTTVASLSAWTGIAQAQPRPTRRIGYLHPRTIAPTHPTLLALRAAWRQLGYADDDTVLLRSADGDVARVAPLARELVRDGAVVLIVVGAEAVRQAVQALPATPIVAIDLETDPVRAGFATSFARPGGQVTGLFLDMPSLAGKWIDLLREAAPGIERIALSWDRSTGADQLDVARQVARAKGYQVAVLDLDRMRRDFEAALRPLASGPRTGVVQLSSAGFIAVAPAFAAAARKYRLPTIAFLKTYAQVGVLLTYGPIQELYFPRAVHMADRIARGDAPGTLPIEGPDRFEFAINLDTARALELSLPQALLLRADEVFQ